MAKTISLLTILSEQFANPENITVISAEKTAEISGRLDTALQDGQREYEHGVRQFYELGPTARRS